MKALGMLELTGIPKGIAAADEMLKAAEVNLIAGHAVCAGKYMAVIEGEVAAVEAAIAAGRLCAGEKLIDSLVIANIHDGVLRALSACTEIDKIEALGILETFSLCAAVLSADAMVKAADVTLLEIRLGRGLGGKSFITLTGDVAAVKAAVEAAGSLEEVQGLMADAQVIPSPHKALIKTLL